MLNDLCAANVVARPLKVSSSRPRDSICKSRLLLQTEEGAGAVVKVYASAATICHLSMPSLCIVGLALTTATFDCAIHAIQIS